MIQNFSESASLRSASPWDVLARDDQGAVLLSPRPHWAAIPVSLLVIPSQASWPGRAASDPYVELALRGSGRRFYRTAGRKRELLTCPRMLELCHAGWELDSAQWEGSPGVCIHVDFPKSSLERIVRDDTDLRGLTARHEFFHGHIARLMVELASEARDGQPNGALYSEGLSLCLLSLLTDTNPKSKRQRAGTRLGPHQTAQLVEYIEQNIGGDLSIQHLADELDLSPFILAKLFKASLGYSPHQYVLARRIERASEELRHDRSTTISEIALAHGFSSHAHFTATYRKAKGASPSVVWPRFGKASELRP